VFVQRMIIFVIYLEVSWRVMQITGIVQGYIKRNCFVLGSNDLLYVIVFYNQIWINVFCFCTWIDMLCILTGIKMCFTYESLWIALLYWIYIFRLWLENQVWFVFIFLLSTTVFKNFYKRIFPVNTVFFGKSCS
jgi:hypothetical protein